MRRSVQCVRRAASIDPQSRGERAKYHCVRATVRLARAQSFTYAYSATRRTIFRPTKASSVCGMPATISFDTFACHTRSNPQGGGRPFSPFQSDANRISESGVPNRPNCANHLLTFVRGALRLTRRHTEPPSDAPHCLRLRHRHWGVESSTVNPILANRKGCGVRYRQRLSARRCRKASHGRELVSHCV
jgi:hypothetical protein